MTTLQCCNCGRFGAPSDFALRDDCAFCPKCRSRAYLVAPTASEAQSLTAGAYLDPSIASGYEAANAMSQNAALINSAADVQAAKDDLRPYFTQTQAAVARSSPPVSPTLQGFWPGFYSEWLALDGSRPTVFSCSEDIAHITRMRIALRAFHEKLLAENPSAPIVIVPLPSPGLLDRLQTAAESAMDKTKKSADDFNTTFRIVVIAGGVLAGYMIYRSLRVVETVAPQVIKIAADNPQLAKMALL